MQLFSIGFQLSFGAAAVLAVLIPIIPKGLIGKMVLAVSFQLVMAPYNAYVFNYFSLIGFVLNIVVILLVSIILPICITMLLIYFFVSCTVCQILLDFGSKLLASLVDLLMRFNEISYRPGYSTFEVTSPSLLGLWLFYGIFFLCISEHFRIIFIRKRRSALALAIVGVISASLIAAYVNDDGFGRCKAVFVDVGQGDCILLKDIEGKNYLFDGGGKEGFAGNKTGYDVGEKILKPMLLKNGIKKIDAAFVTHLHTDHYDGVRSLAKLGMVDKLCVYEANALIEEKILSDTSLASDEIIYACKGDYFKLGEGASVEVIWPERMSKDKYAAAVSDDADENLISLIMRVEVDGCSILVTGDIGQDGEHKLVDIYGKKLKTEILKTSS